MASFPGRAGSRTGRWEGLVAGVAAPPGTYLIVARVLDAAGNVGTCRRRSTQREGAARPAAGPRRRDGARGRGAGAARAGRRRRPVRVKVDAGGRPYRWSIRRAGRSRALDRGRDAARAPASARPSAARGVPVPRADRDGATTIPLVVQAQTPPEVLVVLPAMTWQGLNRSTTTGDGVPNTLDRTGRAQEMRPFARDGLPPGFRQKSALLAFLDRMGMSYDLTTDLALCTATARRCSAGRASVARAGGRLAHSNARAEPARLRAARRRPRCRSGTGSLRRNADAPRRPRRPVAAGRRRRLRLAARADQSLPKLRAARLPRPTRSACGRARTG